MKLVLRDFPSSKYVSVSKRHLASQKYWKKESPQPLDPDDPADFELFLSVTNTQTGQEVEQCQKCFAESETNSFVLVCTEAINSTDEGICVPLLCPCLPTHQNPRISQFTLKLSFYNRVTQCVEYFTKLPISFRTGRKKETSSPPPDFFSESTDDVQEQQPRKKSKISSNPDRKERKECKERYEQTERKERQQHNTAREREHTTSSQPYFSAEFERNIQSSFPLMVGSLPVFQWNTAYASSFSGTIHTSSSSSSTSLYQMYNIPNRQYTGLEDAAVDSWVGDWINSLERNNRGTSTFGSNTGNGLSSPEAEYILTTGGDELQDFHLHRAVPSFGELKCTTPEDNLQLQISLNLSSTQC